MKPKSQERGQALILIVFVAVGLFAFAALAIDGSRIYSDRRHAQNVADTSVLAAALAKIRADTPEIGDAAAVTAGLDRAASNGFIDGTNSVVEVNNCAEPNLDPPCEGLPAGTDPSEYSQYIQVVIRYTTKTTFARILGWNEVSSWVTAIARVQGSSSTSTSTSNPAMFATEDSATANQCFTMSGGANNNLYVHGSGIFINCGGPYAMSNNGTSSLTMDGTAEVVGCQTGGFSPVTCGVPAQSATALFGSVPTTQPPPPCSPSAGSSGSTYTQGTFSSISVSGTATMDPGVYCVDSLTVSGTLSAPNGLVQIVLRSGDLTLTDGAIMNFANLEIYSSSAGVTMVGHSTLNATRLRYFSTGAGKFTIVGNGALTSGNAYLYFQSGNIDWSGDAVLNLHAPPQGDQFGGLLIHKPWGNTSTVTLNGGTNTNLTGTFMVPDSPFRLNGNAAFTLHSQLVASTFEIGGSAAVDIFYDPNENYSPPNSPTIQLTK